MERRLLTLIVIFAAAALLTLRFEIANEGEPGDATLPALPVRAGAWTGRRIPPTEEEIEILGADSVEHVEYRDPSGRSVGLSVVMERRKRASFHPPEYCYLARSDVNIVGKGRTRISLDGATIEASTLVLKIKNATILVLYWYRTGDYHTPSYYKHQLSFIWRWFQSGGSDSVMVRLSTPIGAGGIDGAVNKIEDLVLALAPGYSAF